MTIRFKARLAERKPLIGTLVSWPFPETAEIAADAGFDWLFLDWEHGLHDARSLQTIVQVVGKRLACLIRVPENESTWISKALDSGADGLIIPHVCRAEDAAQAVLSAKYPPQGARSIGVARAQGYGHGVLKSVEEDNQKTVIVAQVEHIDGVRNIEKIAAVAGIDAVFIGPFDLSASMNKPGRISDDEVREAIARVRNTCLRNGRPVGIFAPDVEAAKKALGEGYSLVCVGTDGMFYASIMNQVARESRS
jgi:2-keto-3-deoxy-L-rhamnonate aldolase RhmA